MTSVSRLQMTWERINKKTKQKYEALAVLFDIEEDHKAYRFVYTYILIS